MKQLWLIVLFLGCGGKPMPVTVKFDNTTSSPTQAAVIPDATPKNDGVMTKVQAAKLAGLSATATDLHNVQQQGTLDIGGHLLVTDDNNSNTVLDYQPGETDATKWVEWIQNIANGFGTRQNQVHGVGWNRGPHGVIDPTQGALAEIFEARYQPTNLIRNLEWYLEFSPESGPAFRPIQIDLNLADILAPRIAIGGTSFHLQTSAASDLWVWGLDSGGGLDINAAITPIRFNTPLVPFVRQKSNLGNYTVALIALNGADEIQLGEFDAVDTRIARGLKIGGVPANADAFIENTPGENVAVAPANTARQRYNNLTKQWEYSVDTGAWTTAKYTAANAGNWSGSAPTTIAEALDRIAAKIGPIP